MKKKIIQYLLIFVVLGIWALIAMRFFNFFSADEEKEMGMQKPIDGFTLANVSKPYEIKGNYSDPFLKDGKMNFSSSNNSSFAKVEQPKVSRENEKKKKPEKAVIQNDFPVIQLAGIISNQQSGKKSAIVVQDGKEYSMLTGETVNGIKLAKIFTDSVLVTFQKKNKIIRL
jgi:hypothetical protein